MPTYTQTKGSKTATYFQDVAISPATLTDGSLFARLDQHLYPKKGRTTLPEARGLPSVTVTASTLTPVHAVAFTLTATVAGATKKIGGRYKTGTVTFKDGTTTLGTAQLSGGVATLNVSAGVTTGAHTVTAVYNGKASSAITVTAS